MQICPLLYRSCLPLSIMRMAQLKNYLVRGSLALLEIDETKKIKNKKKERGGLGDGKESLHSRRSECIKSYCLSLIDRSCLCNLY